MHIRPAELKDIPQLTVLGRQLLDLHVEFDSQYYQLEETFGDLFGTWIKEQISGPFQFLFVAEETAGNSDINLPSSSPVLTGFISGFIKSLFPWFRTKTVGHISYLIIDPNYRQKGIGKLLEAQACEWFKSKNISYVEVYVEEKNAIGQGAWSAYGFLPFKKFLRKRLQLP